MFIASDHLLLHTENASVLTQHFLLDLGTPFNVWAVQMCSKTQNESHHPMDSSDQGIRLKAQVPTDFHVDIQSCSNKKGAKR